MNFIDNHDIDRYSTVAKGDVRIYKMALAMLITARGYPQIYYGTEIMLEGIAGSYEGNRFDFPGGWSVDKRNAFCSKGRKASENEVFQYLKTLLHYRKNNTVLQNGKMKQFIPENGCYVTFRYNSEKTVMVIANNNDQDMQLDTKRYDEMFKNKTQGVEVLNGQFYPLNSLALKAKSVLILELK
jgi:glycosidase